MKYKKGYIAIAISALCALFFLTFHFSTKALSVIWDNSIKTNYSYGQAGEIKRLQVNGTDAFCVEWDKSVTTVDGYSIQSYSKQFTKAQWDKLVRIAHVGYNKEKHTNADYAATQVYIWQTVRGFEGLTPSFGGATNIPNFHARIDAIKANLTKLDEVEKTKVSFHDKTIKLKPSTSITLTDTKGVLSKGGYQINTGQLPVGVSAKIKNDSITITASSNASDGEIRLYTKNVNAVKENIFFYHKSSQNVSRLGYVAQNSASVHVVIEKYGKIEITKQDEAGNLVPNTEFRLSKNADMSNPIGTYTTKMDGKVVIENLQAGTYYIQETKVGDHLLLDDKIYKVEVVVNKTVTHQAINKFKKAALQLEKSSSLDKLTSNNHMYSFYGAKYGVFTDEQCSKQIATLTTSSTGKTNIVSLDLGTYYVKEIQPPKGYALNLGIKKIELTTYETIIIKDEIAIDTPKRNPIEFLIEKKDPTSIEPHLENAEFEVSYYDGFYKSIDDIEAKRAEPLRTWRLKTDVQGKVKLASSYKIDGDLFYVDEHGKAVLPLGTITVYETKAPVGYKRNYQIFTKQITNSAHQEDAILTSFSQPIEVLEEPISLTLVKKQEGSSKLMESVVFEYMNPNGEIIEKITNEQGECYFEQLAVGIHRIKETKTLPGYQVLSQEIVFEVKANGEIVLKSKDPFVELHKGQLQYQLSVHNKVNPFDLEIIKMNSNHVLLDGAIFGLYKDRDCTQLVERLESRNGHLVWKDVNLDQTYYLKEEQAPEGYQLPQYPHVYQIKASNNPLTQRFEVAIDGKIYNESMDYAMVSVKLNENHYQVSLSIINDAMPLLPQTGSSKTLWVCFIGLSCMLLSYFNVHIKRRKNYE